MTCRCWGVAALARRLLLCWALALFSLCWSSTTRALVKQNQPIQPVGLSRVRLPSLPKLMPDRKKRPVVVGITGGIATGKSTVTKICQGLGASVIDADQLGHRSYEPGTECFKALVQTFGEGIVGDDGAINRRALGAIVFSDPREKAKLEAIVWPEIKRLIELDLASLKETGASTAVVEAAVMLEAGWESFMDEVWVVAVEPQVARKRLMDRNGYSAEEADKRIRSQMTNEERIAKADRVIWNNGTKEELEEAVTEAWKDRGTLRPLKLSDRARRKILVAFVSFAAVSVLLAMRGWKGRWR